MRFINALMLTAVLALTGSEALPFERPLFDDRTPLQLELEADLRQLCAHSEPDCEAFPARLRVIGGSDADTELPVRLKTRGIFRLDNDNCRIPPLFLYFEPQDVTGTVFDGQMVLPLTLQCQTRRTRYADYVFKEYLAYRLYELFTPRSIRARLVELRLHGSKWGARGTQVQAFFTEHFDHVALRNQARRVYLDYFDPREANENELTVMALFQYLIANTDWSVIDGHNMAYLQAPGEPVSPLPFDFDFSGLVNAEYAGPPRKLPLLSVRQRLYRGFCHERLDWDAVFGRFIESEAAVMAELDAIDAMSSSARRDAKGFLSKFFNIIRSPEKRQKNIEQRCRRL